MTESPNEEAIAKQVEMDWGNRDFWIAKCRYCLRGIDLVMRECAVSRTEAVTLWAAMLHDNAANVMNVALHRYEVVQDKMRPIASKLVDAAEQQIRDDQNPWEKE